MVGIFERARRGHQAHLEISACGEMFSGFASTAGDDCVLARAGGAILHSAWSVAGLFLADAVVALATIIVPYAMRAVHTVAAARSRLSTFP